MSTLNRYFSQAPAKRRKLDPPAHAPETSAITGSSREEPEPAAERVPTVPVPVDLETSSLCNMKCCDLNEPNPYRLTVPRALENQRLKNITASANATRYYI